VDLIGIRQSDEAEWKGRNITEYWKPGSKVRQEADKISYETLKKDEPVTLKSTDSKWKEWFSHGANELLIIADLTGDGVTGEFSSGGEDPRRKFLSLRKKDWDPDEKNTLKIEIKRTSISVLTPQKY